MINLNSSLRKVTFDVNMQHCPTLRNTAASYEDYSPGALLNASSTREDVAYHLCFCARSCWLEA